MIPASLERWIRGLSLAGVLLCFAVILLGAYTRLTNSGISCPDWPECYGHLTPIGAADSARAQARYPGRPLDVEYGRLFALGLLTHLADELSPLFPELESKEAPASLPAPEKTEGRRLSPPATGTSTLSRHHQPVAIIALARANEHGARHAAATDPR